MEITSVINRYSDFISEKFSALPIEIGQVEDSGEQVIRIYPNNYNFAYEQDSYGLIFELALPNVALTDAMQTADTISKVIELDSLDDIRLSNYEVEFYFGEQIAGTVILFLINLFIQRCR